MSTNVRSERTPLTPREGELATNFIDAWRADHFAMEAKLSDPARNNDALLRKAFGQVRNYVSHVSGTPPPYLMKGSLVARHLATLTLMGEIQLGEDERYSISRKVA